MKKMIFPVVVLKHDCPSSVGQSGTAEVAEPMSTTGWPKDVMGVARATWEYARIMLPTRRNLRMRILSSGQ
jgi:hypothetical protein